MQKIILSAVLTVVPTIVLATPVGVVPEMDAGSAAIGLGLVVGAVLLVAERLRRS